jgi:S-adenosylmethionine:tRNA ribosyltransferase-isomerase
MDLQGFDYVLPPERIAQFPLEDRASSRLLVLRRQSGEIEHRTFRDVAELLEPGDLLVRNNTRVTAVRLFGRKATGASVEVLLLRNLGGRRYHALVKPGRRLLPGARLEFGAGLAAEVEAIEPPMRILAFDPVADLEERLESQGYAPLPPYIHAPLADRERYQTVYASQGGSAAAPTAGLHFTPDLLAALEGKGVEIAEVTLDVGLDTFRPVEDLATHKMHGERCNVPPETAEKVAACKGRVIAVGTTSARTLETLSVGPRRLEARTEVSRLFISPGYEWKTVDAMFTNFHMPRTTMLLMISALASGAMIREAYRQALEREYRFLSFGDSMLIL